MAFLSMLEGSMNEPKNFNQAWNHPDKKEQQSWHQAITKELTDMKKRGVWEIINKNSIPKDQSLIGNKWVLKQKKWYILSLIGSIGIQSSSRSRLQ